MYVCLFRDQRVLSVKASYNTVDIKQGCLRMDVTSRWMHSPDLTVLLLFDHRSPHLVEVRDRFHVNGQRISRDQFALYFWECYNRFQETKVCIPYLNNLLMAQCWLVWHVFTGWPRRINAYILQVSHRNVLLFVHSWTGEDFLLTSSRGCYHQLQHVLSSYLLCRWNERAQWVTDLKYFVLSFLFFFLSKVYFIEFGHHLGCWFVYIGLTVSHMFAGGFLFQL